MTGWLLPAAVLAVAILYASVGHAGATGLGGWLAGGRSLAAIDPWVVAAAAAGGLVGSHLGTFKLPVRWLRLLMAVVLAVASMKLLGECLRPAAALEGGLSVATTAGLGCEEFPAEGLEVAKPMLVSF